MRLTTFRNLLLALAMVVQTVAGGAGLARAASISPEATLSGQCHHLRAGEQPAPNDRPRSSAQLPIVSHVRRTAAGLGFADLGRCCRARRICAVRRARICRVAALRATVAGALRAGAAPHARLRPAAGRARARRRSSICCAKQPPYVFHPPARCLQRCAASCPADWRRRPRNIVMIRRSRLLGGASFAVLSLFAASAADAQQALPTISVGGARAAPRHGSRGSPGRRTGTRRPPRRRRRGRGPGPGRRIVTRSPSPRRSAAHCQRTFRR